MVEQEPEIQRRTMKLYFFLQPGTKFYREGIVCSLRIFPILIIGRRNHLFENAVSGNDQLGFFLQWRGFFMNFHNLFVQDHTRVWPIRHGHKMATLKSLIKTD